MGSGPGPWGQTGSGALRTGKAGQVHYWQYERGKRDLGKAGQVHYWQYGQAEKSPDLAISDLSRFRSRILTLVREVPGWGLEPQTCGL